MTETDTETETVCVNRPLLREFLTILIRLDDLFLKKAPLLAPSLVREYLLVHLECHTHLKGCLHGAIYLLRIMDCMGF